MLQFTWRALRYMPDPTEGKPDVVIGSSPHPLAAWAGQRLARLHGVPFVFEVRDLWPQSLIDLGTFGPRNPLAVALRTLEGFLYRRAALVISLLPYAHEYIERFRVPRERVFYLPNGVDLSDFPAERAPDGRDPFTLMYFGAHGAPNALDTLLDTAGELERRPASRPVLWRFIGEGTEKFALMRRASEAGLRSVSFEGRVPKSRIPTLAAEADGFVMNVKGLPVYRYGISPNKLFDYLAARRPVIFASSAGNNPVAEAGAGITVPPENPPAVAEAVRRLVSLSPEERDEMGLRGRRYVEAHHDYERLGERLEKALEGLVATA
jgi:glycosyltransferase involved in cell wall biosynthesis